MSIPIRLKRVASSHNNLRTDELIGVLAFIPMVGECIHVVADPLDPMMSVRAVATSPVQRIEGAIYYTENSTYEIEFLETL